MQNDYDRYGKAGPCPLCGVLPSYDAELGQYDPDFIYPVGHLRVAGVETGWLNRGAKNRLLHANCNHVWGGCGHVVVGYSAQGLIRDWNAYGPDLLVRKDLPGMEAMILAYEEECKIQLEAIQEWLKNPNEDGSKRHHYPRGNGLLRRPKVSNALETPEPTRWWENQETIAEIKAHNLACRERA